MILLKGDCLYINGADLSKWPGKYVIGLTGNIGTGKSVVRRMLEHLGAFGLDADLLGHRILAKGASGYLPILATFGSQILTPQGEIDRSKLGRLVFSDPAAMAELEAIIHPSVLMKVGQLVERAHQRVVVIEAIKLFETELVNTCDSLWGVYASPETQLRRLMQNRRMSEEDARQRIASQPPQESRFDRAAVIIKNDGTVEETWQQVSSAWQRLIPTTSVSAYSPLRSTMLSTGEGYVQRIGPLQIDEMTDFINLVQGERQPIHNSQTKAQLADKIFYIIKHEQSTVAAIGWQAENLIARITDFYISNDALPEQCLPPLVQSVEQAAIDLQCEVVMLRLPPSWQTNSSLWQRLGYRETAAEEIPTLAWREAAQALTQESSSILMKPLKLERVLHPF